jgi:hypothetical protein
MEHDTRSDNAPDLASATTQATLLRIDEWLQRRADIADALRTVAASVSGVTSRRMHSLADWFDAPPSQTPPQGKPSAMDVLRHDDALVTCSYLLSHGNSVADWQPLVHDAARYTCGQLRQLEVVRRRWLPELVYPLFLVLVGLALTIIASFLLVPEFEVAYDDDTFFAPNFLTTVVFGVATLVRQVWMFGVMALLSLAALLFLIVIPGRSMPPWLQWMRFQSLGLRTAWMRWAWTTGWLLKIGLDRADAVRFAGQQSAEGWMRRNSLKWSDDLRGGLATMSASRSSSSREPWQPYGLLSQAFRLDDRHDQASLLFAYAAIQRDLASQRRLWWLSWITPLIILLIGAGILLLAIGLYAPLFDTSNLMQGLT